MSANKNQCVFKANDAPPPISLLIRKYTMSLLGITWQWDAVREEAVTYRERWLP